MGRIASESPAEGPTARAPITAASVQDRPLQLTQWLGEMTWGSSSFRRPSFRGAAPARTPAPWNATCAGG
ncbi:hypothetical protein GCM10022416_10140 [Actinomadura keratinilytica]|uniref:Uncharacterized protein n=1 Tax=Actinomadura keratinilytica TaxID=547461 RepID=A0ABP7Y6F7_9ACTN